MKRYVVYKGMEGDEDYVRWDGTFTKDVKEAKEYKVRWWVDLINIILKILIVFGITDRLKFKRIG